MIVSDLQIGFSPDDLKKLFSTCGNIEYVLPLTADSAYIVFDSASAVQSASDTFDGQLFDGAVITVKRCPSDRGREVEHLVQQIQIESGPDVKSSDVKLPDVTQLCDQLSHLTPNDLKTICKFLSAHIVDDQTSSGSVPHNTLVPKSVSQSPNPPGLDAADPLPSGSVQSPPDSSGMVLQNHVSPTQESKPSVPPGFVPPNHPFIIPCPQQSAPPGLFPNNSMHFGSVQSPPGSSGMVPQNHVSPTQESKPSVPPGFVPPNHPFIIPCPQQSVPPGLFPNNSMHFGSVPQSSVPRRAVPQLSGSVPQTNFGSSIQQNNPYGSVPYMSNLPGFYGQPPRVSQFSGQDQKGDVSFDLWQAEISGLKEAGYPMPVLLHAVRKSLKGRAADMLLNMGNQVTLDQLLLKFKQVFGIVCSPQLLLEKFYNSNQNHDEAVSSWACRLEDILRMLQDRGYTFSDQMDSMLRSKFWTGLCCSSVKNGIRHLYDDRSSYAELLVAARLVEQEESLPAVVSQQITTPKSEYTELLMEISKLNKRLSDMESKQKSSFNRSAFKGKCFKCGSVGHRKVDCTTVSENE